MTSVSNNLEDVLDMSMENIERLKEQSTRIRIEEIMRCINILQEAEDGARGTKQGRIYLELALIKMCKIKYDTSIETVLGRINRLEERIATGDIEVSKEVNEVKKIKPLVNKESYNGALKDSLDKTQYVNETVELNEDSKLTVDDIKRSFKDIQGALKQKNNMVLATALMMGRITEFNKGIITITFTKEYNFHKVRLERDEYKKVVNQIFSEILDEKVSVLYKVENDTDEGNVLDKGKLISDMFPSNIVEVFDE